MIFQYLIQGPSELINESGYKFKITLIGFAMYLILSYRIVSIALSIR